MWLAESNRWKHLLGGMAVGLFADSPYCGAYAGAVAASCLEFKDKVRGGAWDWADWGCTLAGALIVVLIKWLWIG